jgi:hypothetical protein
LVRRLRRPQPGQRGRGEGGQQERRDGNLPKTSALDRSDGVDFGFTETTGDVHDENPWFRGNGARLGNSNSVRNCFPQGNSTLGARGVTRFTWLFQPKWDLRCNTSARQRGYSRPVELTTNPTDQIALSHDNDGNDGGRLWLAER